MYKKQICKVSFKSRYNNGNDYNGYGICIGDNSLLLENNNILKEIQEGNYKGQYKLKNSLFTNINGIYTKNRYGDLVNNVKISATRNVPEDIREVMENAGTSAIKMLQMEEKFNRIKDEYTEKIKAELENVTNMPEKIRASKGTLSKQEFIDCFTKNLSSKVKYAMENSVQRGYSGEDGNWEINIYSNNLTLRREVWIDKWATPSFTYLEYDDTRQISSDAEKNPEYQSYMRKYSKHLPVKEKIEEYLSLGDKNSLEYYGEYTIKLNPKCELTKEYAAEIANKFCGVEKEKEEEIER